MELTQQLFMLFIYGLLPLLVAQFIKPFDTQGIRKNLGQSFMKIPAPLMMLLMAIPEQSVLYLMEPQIPLINRLLVSVAMYVIHFAWNGFMAKPKYSYNELVWIIGTALFAYYVTGVSKETAIALIAADSVMTLSLRGLV